MGFINAASFECVLNNKQYKQLQVKMRKVCEWEEDNLRFYPVSSHTLSQVEVWGVGAEITQSGTSVIV